MDTRHRESEDTIGTFPSYIPPAVLDRLPLPTPFNAESPVRRGFCSDTAFLVLFLGP